MADLTRDLTELERLAAWRTVELLDAGYEISTVEILAPRFEIDLHKACELRLRGCDDNLALEILI